MNPATAHYHFGSKEALYRGVVDAYIHDVQQERRERLARIDPKLVGRPRLKKLLYDYFYPHVKLAATESGYSYARILAHVQSEFGDTAAKIFSDTVSPTRHQYVRELKLLFPNASTAEVRRVLMMGVALMAVVSTWHNPNGAKESEIDRRATELAGYAAAGFEATFGKPVGA